MSHLLRRTKKSCLKLLRKISTSKQLFVQRLDEDDEDEEEQQQQERQQQQLEEYISCSYKAETIYDEQHACQNNTNNSPSLSVQCFEPQQQQQHLQQQQQQQQTSIDIQFDRVHYKENVRYLRHTPSNSSLDLHSEQQQQQQQLLQQQQQQLQQQQQQLQKQLLKRELTAVAPPPRACSVSLGSKFDGNYHNVIITEQPPNDDYPIVKWDINGNSLDEESFDLRQHWDAFDNRWRQLQSSQSKRLGSGHSHSQRSSHYSSSCTLETWIDDAELGLCDESQNLLQSNTHNNHNNHNNHSNKNCNQCLKSF